MDEINKLKTEVFDILRQQAILQQNFNQFEQIKNEKLKQIGDLEQKLVIETKEEK